MRSNTLTRVSNNPGAVEGPNMRVLYKDCSAFMISGRKLNVFTMFGINPSSFRLAS